ncbi:hypothetical protein CEXT_89151 [Caerostris extrusa]|uniref:Uncharacterized protein n=1 Tax=Caerostris extrusa TaxID=172846 RepID=A0AAV4SY59_CAEEX|nr:hypothetical protein CEXT_89151 [Caerostris extrusa]
MYAPSRPHPLFLGTCMLLLDLTPCSWGHTSPPVPGALYAPSRPHPPVHGAMYAPSRPHPPVHGAMYAPSRPHPLFLGLCMLLLDLTPVPGAMYAPSRPHPCSWGHATSRGPEAQIPGANPEGGEKRRHILSLPPRSRVTGPSSISLPPCPLAALCRGHPRGTHVSGVGGALDFLPLFSLDLEWRIASIFSESNHLEN